MTDLSARLKHFADTVNWDAYFRIQGIVDTTVPQVVTSSQESDMAETQFQIGDRVRATTSTFTWGLVKGDMYTVLKVWENGNISVHPEEAKKGGGWMPSRFELVSAAPTFPSPERIRAAAATSDGAKAALTTLFPEMFPKRVRQVSVTYANRGKFFRCGGVYSILGFRFEGKDLAGYFIPGWDVIHRVSEMMTYDECDKDGNPIYEEN